MGQFRNLLLLGSLYAVGFGLSTIIFEGYYGFWEFAVRITPLKPSIFTIVYTDLLKSAEKETADKMG